MPSLYDSVINAKTSVGGEHWRFRARLVMARIHFVRASGALRGNRIINFAPQRGVRRNEVRRRGETSPLEHFLAFL